jgi:AhpC/TSA family
VKTTIARIAAVIAVTAVVACLFLFPIRNQPLKIGPPSHDSELPGDLSLLTDDVNEISRAAATTVAWLFLSPDCPISTAYVPELNRLAREFGRAGVRFVGVIPGTTTSAEEATTHLRDFAISFPVVYDRGNIVCQRLGATHTPQAIVKRHGRVVYSGRIDDLYADIGQKRMEASRRDLRDALMQITQDLPVDRQSSQPIGCLIPGQSSTPPSASRSRNEGYTFTRDIAPIMFGHCSECHRPDTAAPFSLLTYEDARQHADQIAVVVTRGLMPPWKPEAHFGEFANEHRLTPREIEAIVVWTDAGQAQGDLSALPPAPTFRSGWHLGPPDLELIMPEPFTVPADGPDIYQHFVIPTGLIRDRLVNAVDFRPGAAEVVHHSITYFDTTGQGRKMDAAEPGPGYSRIGSPGFQVSGSLGGWGPGGTPRRLPYGMGRPLQKDSDLVVQIHYHPIGRSMQDQSRIGLYFAPATATRPVTEIMVANVDLAIPAGKSRHHHHAEYTVPVNTIVFDATPHMHVLGQEIKAVAFLPGGTELPLIWIRDWDFYWQDNYVYKKPLQLPSGTRIELDCWFDNSDENPLNPNSPPQDVSWGDFSTDEMGICYFQATTETWDDYVTLNQHATEYFAALWTEYQERVAK